MDQLVVRGIDDAFDSHVSDVALHDGELELASQNDSEWLAFNELEVTLRDLAIPDMRASQYLAAIKSAQDLQYPYQWLRPLLLLLFLHLCN